MKTRILDLLVVGLLFCLPSTGYSAGWEFLFNGQNLSGWKTVGDQAWNVKDGYLEAKAVGKEMGWLVTEKTYSDFVLRFRFKWYGGNSGIQFRSRLDGTKMIGYQANLDPSRPNATGSLLDENGRGPLQESKIKADQLFKKDQWNEYEISAIGDHITIHVNGESIVDFNDPQGAKDGIIALQMAPGEKAGVDWTDIRILEIKNKADWISLFNGIDLTGWHPLGESEWNVQDGYIHGSSKGGDYGWLVSDKEYTDFHFTTRFKVPKGNSGIQFRSWAVEKMIHGFQADIASDSDWINGHLYDQSEKGIVVKPKQDFSKIIDWNGWNTYEITAIGPKVELFINGIKSIEHTDPTRLKGVFAFQLHAGIVMETDWKDLRIIQF